MPPIIFLRFREKSMISLPIFSVDFNFKMSQEKMPKLIIFYAIKINLSQTFISAQ